MRTLSFFIMACLVSGPAQAQEATQEAVDDGYPSVEQVHSDLPLYTFDWKELWPRSFTDSESFGCSTRVSYGDWKFTPHPDDEYGEDSWYRFRNYGVFHCAAIFETADERGELDQTDWKYGFFVKLGEMEAKGKAIELWTIQQGMRPGSDYTLLSRSGGADGLINEFTLLQQKCAPKQVREIKGHSMDVWSTRYCAINSQDDLLALARAMAVLKPIGTIKLMPNEKGPDETPDPSE